ncbi:hypothetical protein [Cohnella fermenti]|uniref:Uncharacterized protein n=1 Tax=Cohnella fermenti TaxID=2565925 RepID=A0A4S4BF00_9BACL|nr:hypothetical protein [Cohnella fermenti]THF72850.1 hypothetical protein E6C55_31765 [Cohnella fermenti]
MGVRYELGCFECDVLVRESEGAAGGYQLSIQARSNPLGKGNPIADYETEAEATEAADRFCQLYTLAREYGYHLHGGDFRREDCSRVSVADQLKGRMDPDRFRTLLEEEARIHDLPLPS